MQQGNCAGGQGGSRNRRGGDDALAIIQVRAGQLRSSSCWRRESQTLQGHLSTYTPSLTTAPNQSHISRQSKRISTWSPNSRLGKQVNQKRLLVFKWISPVQTGAN